MTNNNTATSTNTSPAIPTRTSIPILNRGNPHHTSSPLANVDTLPAVPLGVYVSPDPSPIDPPTSNTAAEPRSLPYPYTPPDLFRDGNRPLPGIISNDAQHQPHHQQSRSIGVPSSLGLGTGLGLSGYHNNHHHHHHHQPHSLDPSGVKIEVDPYYVPALPPGSTTTTGHPQPVNTASFATPAQPRGKGRGKSNNSNGGNNGKKVSATNNNNATDNKQPSFLTKLYGILETPEYQHIIRWDEKGEVIIIERPDELAEKILPAVYRQSRFASFSRQLNIYGFMRKVSLRHMESEIVDPDASTWSHPFLRRDSPQADIIGFKRRVPPRPSQAKRRFSMPEETLSPTSSEGSPSLYTDPYASHLLPEAMTIPTPDNRYAYQPRGTLPLFFDHPQSPQEPPSIAPASLYHDRRLSESTLSAAPTYPAVMSAGRPVFHKERSAAITSPTWSTFNTNYIPASAPAQANSFPNDSGFQVMQGHFRTRSVQGEPPSATLFSPTSPNMAAPGWLPFERIEEGQTLGTNYNMYDQNQPLWMKRSSYQSGPAQGGYMSYDSPPNIPGLGMGDLALGMSPPFGPASLPPNFAPPPAHRPPSRIGGTGHLRTQSYTTPSSWSSSSPYHLSPGQPGSSLQHTLHGGITLSPKARPSTTSSITMTKLDRRNSLSSNPYYSPRGRPVSLLPSLLGRRDSVVYGTPPGDDVRSGREKDDEALPSGGIKVVGDEYPFDAVFRDHDKGDEMSD